MRNFFAKINRYLAELCGWLLSIIAILLAVDIFSRAIMKPLLEVTSLAVFVMMAVIYLGLANCEQVDGHVAVNIFEQKFPPKIKRINTLTRYVVELVIMGAAVFFVGKNSLQSFISKEALSGPKMLPLWPAKLSMSIGLVFFWIQILLNFLKQLGLTGGCKTDNGSSKSPTGE